MLKQNMLVLLMAAAIAWVSSGCQQQGSGNGQTAQDSAGLHFDSSNGGLTLPAGFKAVVVAQNIGRARHLAVRDNGDIYVGLNSMKNGGGIVALRDVNGDGIADSIVYFGHDHGSGAAIHNGYLYFAEDTAVIRFKLVEGSLLPDTAHPELLVTLPVQHEHEAKSITFDGSGNMYVNVGAPSNACQVEDRTKGSPGQQPCPLLENHAGIWRFSDSQPNQTQQNGGSRYATGLRNCVALAWNPAVNKLYAAMHGRDQLNQLYPQYYNEQQGAETPAEEFFQIKEGGNYGWPYVYYDLSRQKLMVCPEYGGDGKKESPEGKYEDPIMAFPGHWAPDGLLFYTGDQFPSQYKNGAFIAFHGSWNRAPLPQGGYKVVFVPFNGDKPAGDSTVFADNFAGTDSLQNPGDAKHRPVGLAQGPDGSLYITDDSNGYIWRIVYTGQ